MRLTTFNVNGIRASMQKGLREYLLTCDADIICLQETKAQEGQCDVSFLTGYRAIWCNAVKKGYSGTLILSRAPVLSHRLGLDIEGHDQEGRVISAEFADFHLVNVYTPNAQGELARLPYRQEWDADFRAHCKRLETTKPVLICGDLNVAHEEIDLANPKSNRMNPGFSDEERAGFGQHLASGFVDVFRQFQPGPGHYTWWTQRTGDARAKNIGWRLDYWLASHTLRPRLQSCTIRADIQGSDHCPVEMVIA
jgi:exodeoxyribonuclease-3